MKDVFPNKKLVVIADDYGFTESVNKGIEKAFSEGIITEISLMVNSKASKQAFSTIKKNKMKNVGIHIDFSTGKIMHEKDYIDLFEKKSYKEVSKMFQDEIRKFERGIKKSPTHITSHKGIHGNIKLLNEIIDYAKELKIPVRRPHVDLMGITLDESNYAAEIMMQRAGLKTTNHLFMHIKGADSVRIKEKYINDLKTVKKGESAEFLFHPAFFDEELLESSSLNFERCRDLAIVTDKIFKDDIKKLGFKIVDYSEI